MNKFGRSEVGIVRALFFLGLLALIPFGQLVGSASTPDWQQCVYREMFWPNPNLSAATADLLGWILRLSLLTAAVGILTTVSYWVVFLSLSVLMLNWLPLCFSTNQLTPFPIIVLIWAFLDKNSGYRVDNLLFAKSDSKVSATTALLVPIQRATFVLIFFSAGLTKLLNGGLAWAQAPTLQDILILQNFLFEGAHWHFTFANLNHWLSGNALLCASLSVAALTLELSAPLACLHRRAAQLIIPGLAVLQLGIFVLLYIEFLPWAALYLFWIPSAFLKRLEYLRPERK